MFVITREDTKNADFAPAWNELFGPKSPIVEAMRQAWWRLFGKPINENDELRNDYFPVFVIGLNQDRKIIFTVNDIPVCKQQCYCSYQIFASRDLRFYIILKSDNVFTPESCKETFPFYHQSFNVYLLSHLPQREFGIH